MDGAFDYLQRDGAAEIDDDFVKKTIRDVLAAAGTDEFASSPSAGEPASEAPAAGGRRLSSATARKTPATTSRRPGSTSTSRPSSSAAAPTAAATATAAAIRSRPATSGPGGADAPATRRTSSGSMPPPQSGSTAAVALPDLPDGAPSTSMLDVPGQPEATIRLHKARIVALEADVSAAAAALAERDRQLAEAAAELKALRAEKAGWAKGQKEMERQVERHKKAADEAAAAAAAAQAQLKEASKDGSTKDKERKAAEADARAREVRLQRALEEVEKYKALLSDVKAGERDLKDASKEDVRRLQTDNRKLERQKAELVVAFKKQLKLIDVLKRQKVHLEAARCLQFSEEEFMRLLDLGHA